MALLVSNLIWPGDDGDAAGTVAERLQLPPEALGAVRLLKRSLDARHGRQVWRATYKVEVDAQGEILARGLPSVRAWTERDEHRYGLHDPTPPRLAWGPGVRPIVVGAGPAGLYAALWLAESGARVLLLERGEPVEARVGTVNANWRGRRPLDPQSNVVFGEGGAGTFSDGKIYTRRRDGDLGYIFRRLVDFGADPKVLEEAWAHLGTDRVREILPRFRARLHELGVQVRFGARVSDLVVRDGACRGVVLADGSVEHGHPVVVATGHSARDAAEMLVRAGVRAEARPIAVGARIEHPQALIDAARYGGERGALPPATYRLTWQGDRKAHTFCMCPGGMVVPATNHLGRVVVNGMSFAARRALSANSAVIVEVRPEDYGSDDPLAGYAFQDRIEQACFVAGGGDYRAPAQRVVDLLAGRASSELPRTSYPQGVTPADLRKLLPAAVIDGMIAAIEAFETEIPGFAGPDAVLIAPETRTTSPVRFVRDAEGCATTVADLYPAGEGAGYGGGIVSCALDGYRIARAIARAHATTDTRS